MLRFFALRLALPAVLAATLVPAAVHAQSDNAQSVAEAARRAREQKKAAAKPAKVVTEDDVKPASSGATAASATSAQPATAGQPDSAGAPGPKSSLEAAKAAKERAALKEQIKQAQSDLDLLQRELRLDQDSFYSSPNYASDTAGKEKLDALKQQVSDKQQELDRLKAQLDALPESQESPASTPPKS